MAGDEHYKMKDKRVLTKEPELLHEEAAPVLWF